MVPVLLGMDHLSGREARKSAMTIGFHTGLALESLNPNPEVFQLPSNSKGRDIVYYLTKGFTNLHGTSTIHVLEGALQSAELQTLEFHPVESYYYDMTMSEKQFEAKVLERSRQNKMAIHARVHSTSASSEAHSASMCHRDPQRPPNSSQSASLLSNGMAREPHQSQQRDMVELIKSMTP